jgi:hypothetical protein
MTAKTLIVVFLGLIAFGHQLWGAWARGKITVRYGGAVERRKQPIAFWLGVSFYSSVFVALALLLIGAAMTANSN